MSHVYIISASTPKVIKIGISKNPEGRLKELQTASPFELKLRFTSPEIKNPYEIEKAVHDVFKKHRLNGEWFKLDHRLAKQEILEQINEKGIIIPKKLKPYQKKETIKPSIPGVINSVKDIKCSKRPKYKPKF